MQNWGHTIHTAHSPISESEIEITTDGATGIRYSGPIAETNISSITIMTSDDNDRALFSCKHNNSAKIR